MQTYLYLHKENVNIPQAQYRGKYLLKHMDYELSRSVGRKGEIVSDVCGGEIRVVIDGFADSTLFGWLFDTFRKEDGEIVVLDEHEKTVSKLHFAVATARQFRLNYDSRVKEGLVTIFIIEAKEIVTDNDLFFQKK
ncbi:type VI secretion system tube protein TssD [Bacteroides sp.]